MDIATLGLSIDSRQVTAATAALDKLPAAAAKAQAASTALASTTRLNNFQLTNMSMQMNDMAVMLASGQNPFVMLMQQGMQVAQIFGSGTGVAAALKMTGAALVSFATNPLTLTVIGFAAAAGAANMLVNALSSADDQVRLLERQKEIVADLERAYDDATGAATKFGEAERSALQLRAMVQRIELTERLRDVIRDLDPSRTATTQSMFANWSVPKGFIDEWARMQQHLAAGTMSVVDVRERLSQLALAFPTRETMLFVAGLLEATQEAYDLETALDDLGNAADKAGKKVGEAFAWTGAMRNRFGDAFGEFDTLNDLRDELNRFGEDERRRANDAERDAERRKKAIDDVTQALQFEASILGMNSTQQRIANELRAAGIDATNDQGRAIIGLVTHIEEWNAAQERMSTLQGDVKSFLGDVRSELKQGETVWESFANAGLNALDRLASKMMNFGVDQFISKMFGFALGGIGGPSVGALASASLFHSGGVVKRPTKALSK